MRQKNRRWKARPPVSKNKTPSRKATFQRHRAQLHCLRTSLRHYENFFVLGPLTPRRLLFPLASLYAFCRYSDDLADEIDDRARARIQLADWEAALTESLKGHPSPPILRALAYTVERYNLPPPLLYDLLGAFRQDLEVNRYTTFSELRDYTRRSADPVGRLVLRLYGYDNPELDALSDSICTALQLANFCQDIGADAQRERLYLPLDECRQFEVDPADILELTPSLRLERLLHFQVVRAYRLLQAGSSLPERLNGSFRVSVRLFILGGLQILDNVRRDPLRALRQRVKITSRQKLMALWRAWKSNNDRDIS